MEFVDSEKIGSVETPTDWNIVDLETNTSELVITSKRLAGLWSINKTRSNMGSFINESLEVFE